MLEDGKRCAALLLKCGHIRIQVQSIDILQRLKNRTVAPRGKKCVSESGR
jgi:hypothetical protein